MRLHCFEFKNKGKKEKRREKKCYVIGDVIRMLRERKVISDCSIICYSLLLAITKIYFETRMIHVNFYSRNFVIDFD